MAPTTMVSQHVDQGLTSEKKTPIETIIFYLYMWILSVANQLISIDIWNEYLIYNRFKWV